MSLAVPDAERLRTAAEEFDAGRRSYKLKDFAGAAVHFENADRDAPSADAVLAAIRSRHEARQLARAATLSASGLARYPQDNALVDFGNRVIAEAEKVLHKITVTCTPECTLVLDDKLVPVSESATFTLFVDPGPHSLVAGWPGERRLVRDVTAFAAGSSAFALIAPPKPSIDSEHPPVGGNRGGLATGRDEGVVPAPAKGLPPVVFFSVAGATALLGGITIWSGVDTLQNPGTDTVRDACRSAAPDCQSLYDKGVAHQVRTNYLLAGTAGLAIATAVVGVFFTNWSGRSTTANHGISLAPMVAVHDGLSVGALGRF